MARKSKKNIEFYQHYTNADQHAKFKMLRVKYGWGGEGKFWALNNRIGMASECCLNISKKYNLASIAHDLDFSIDEFKEFIDFLLNECELIYEVYDGCITTGIIQDNYQVVAEKRDKAKSRKSNNSSPELSQKKHELKNSSPELSQNSVKKTQKTELFARESTQSKVNKSKVNKTKENKKTNLCENNFKLFWEEYPKKRGKGQAEKTWDRINPDEHLFKVILLKIAEAKKSKDWIKQSGQFIPHPSTWLNNKGWEDEYEQKQQFLSDTGMGTVRMLNNIKLEGEI